MKRFQKGDATVPALIRNNSDDFSENSPPKAMEYWKRQEQQNGGLTHTPAVTPSPEKKKKQKKKQKQNHTKETIQSRGTRTKLTFHLNSSEQTSMNTIREDDSTVSSSSHCQDGIERFFHKQTAYSKHGRNERKIFILLMQPKTKKFELIDVVFASREGTIGDILRLIPSNATDEALGQQRHIGFCRPTDGIEMTDLSCLARGSKSYYKIKRGEILVAIPKHYSGQQCKQMAISILNHPALSKLLRHANPLSTSSLNQPPKRPPLIHTHNYTHTHTHSHKQSPKHPHRTSKRNSNTPRPKKIHFDIEPSCFMNSSQPPNRRMSDNRSTNASVMSNATGRSYFSSFLENERLYHQQQMKHSHMEDMASVNTILSKVPHAMSQTISHAIGTMSNIVSHIVAPEDSEVENQPHTRAIIHRGNRTPPSHLDPLNSLKVFAAFLSLFLTRHFTKPSSSSSYYVSAQSATAALTTQGTFLVAGVVAMLFQMKTRFASVVHKSRQKDRNAKSKQRRALDTIMGKQSSLPSSLPRY